MSLLEKPGSAAVTCDCVTCHMDVLARTPEQAVRQAAVEGWQDQPTGGHLCPDCQVGNCPGAAAAEGRYGTDRLTVRVIRDVTAGEEVRRLDGEVAGRFTTAVKAGEIGEIDLVQPPTGKQPVAGARSCLAGRPKVTGPAVAFTDVSWQTGSKSPGGGTN